MYRWQPSSSSLSITVTRYVLCLIVVGINAVSSHDSEWEIECVDCPKLFESFTDHCFCIDANGRPHVAYGRDHLYYAWHNGESWQYETVDEAPLVGIHASMAVDADGHPHVSYFDDRNDDLKYAWRDDAGWQIATVDPGSGGYHVTCSIGVDPEGLPHISYHSYSPFFSLKYARFDGADWLVETVDPHGEVVDYNSIAMDGSGRPHISYTANGPKYAFRDESGWNIEDLGIASAGYTSLQVDKSGVPHIVFGYPSVHYATRSNTSWVMETIDAQGGHVSLFVDDSNWPHVSYCASNAVKYAQRIDSGWLISTADSTWGYVGRSSLCLDASVCPHIVHERQGELRIARFDQSGWTLETVDEQGSVGQYNSLALDDCGHPYIAYYDGHSKDLKYAVRGPLGWECQTVESQGQVGQHTSIAICPEGLPHISYTGNVAGAPGVLRYAFNDGVLWHIEPVDDQSGMHQLGRYNSLKIDDSGNSHISYPDRDYVGSDCDLRYGLRDSSGWHLQTVDDVGYCGNYTSLALDELARPHISYFGSPDLRYAFWNGSEWHLETVATPEDPELETGLHTSLVLDGIGNAYIGHVFDWWAGPPDIGFGVRVADNSATEWRIDDIEEWLNSETMTSIALDPLGRLHIVYWYGTYEEHVLRLAWFDGGRWRVESITSDSPTLDIDYASIAIDADGNRHVTYYDRLLQDLLYAFSPAPAGCQTPDEFSLSMVSLRVSGPCPTSGKTSLLLGLPSRGMAKLTVHDASGRLIRLLCNGILDKGEHLLTWDGNTDRGPCAPSGSYIISAEAGGQRRSKRIVVIR
jgi:hypothetical protein